MTLNVTKPKARSLYRHTESWTVFRYNIEPDAPRRYTAPGSTVPVVAKTNDSATRPHLHSECHPDRHQTRGRSAHTTIWRHKNTASSFRNPHGLLLSLERCQSAI